MTQGEQSFEQARRLIERMVDGAMHGHAWGQWLAEAREWLDSNPAPSQAAKEAE